MRDKLHKISFMIILCILKKGKKTKNHQTLSLILCLWNLISLELFTHIYLGGKRVLKLVSL